MRLWPATYFDWRRDQPCVFVTEEGYGLNDITKI